MAKKNRPPPPGCLFPLAPVEVHQYFPGVGSVRFSSISLASDDRCIVFSMGWYPNLSSRQPVLSIYPVPSDSRDAVRQWFENVAWPDAQSWMKDVLRRKPDSNESSHTYWWLTKANQGLITA